MYCRYCGTKIADDSIFCKSCGKKLFNNIEVKREIKAVNITQEVNTKENKGEGFKIFLFFLIGIIICSVSYFSLNKINVTEKLVERRITDKHYTVVTTLDETAYTLMLTPNIDIIYCDVQCSFYNEDSALLSSTTLSEENLIKDNTYTFIFDYSDLNASEVSFAKYYVTGKYYKVKKTII